MKKNKKCIFIALAVILGWYLTVDIVNKFSGKDLIFYERWLFSNKEYAKNIEIKSYILTDEQASYVLAHPEEDIKQPDKSIFYKNDVNLVLRFKNLKDVTAWGAISYKIFWTRFTLYLRDIGSKGKYYTYVIPIGRVVFSKNDNPPEDLKIRWESLYTYP